MDDPDDECTIFRRRDIRFQKAPSPPRNALASSRLLALLDRLGLRDFLVSSRSPPVEEELCSHFIKSFNRRPSLMDGGEGIVHGQPIVLCAHTVHKLTGLPLGDELRPSPSVASPANASILREMFPVSKSSRSGYRYLPRISRRVDDADEFVAIARMLMEVLLCQTDKHDYAEAAILVGMRFSQVNGVVMPWAVLLSRRMVEAVMRSKERKGMFVFGHWLTGLIRSQLKSSSSNATASKKRGASCSLEDEENSGKGCRSAKQRRYASEKVAEALEVEKQPELIDGVADVTLPVLVTCSVATDEPPRELAASSRDEEHMDAAEEEVPFVDKEVDSISKVFEKAVAATVGGDEEEALAAIPVLGEATVTDPETVDVEYDSEAKKTMLLDATGLSIEPELTMNGDDKDAKAVRRRSLLCELVMLRQELQSLGECNEKLELAELEEEVRQLTKEVAEARYALALEKSRATPKETVRRLRDRYIVCKKLTKELQLFRELCQAILST